MPSLVLSFLKESFKMKSVLLLLLLSTTQFLFSQNYQAYKRAQIFNSKVETDSINLFNRSTEVAQLAEYPGGENELQAKLKRQMQYPQMEFDNHLTGTVMIRALIDSMGTVVDLKPINQTSKGLEREALRLVKNLVFVPAFTVTDKPVSSYFVVPVKFELLDTGLVYSTCEEMPKLKLDMSDENRVKYFENLISSRCGEGEKKNNHLVVSCVVEPTGKLTNYKIEKTVCEKVDAEGLEKLKKLELTIGKQQGKPVRAKYTFVVPIK